MWNIFKQKYKPSLELIEKNKDLETNREIIHNMYEVYRYRSKIIDAYYGFCDHKYVKKRTKMGGTIYKQCSKCKHVKEC